MMPPLPRARRHPWRRTAAAALAPVLAAPLLLHQGPFAQLLQRCVALEALAALLLMLAAPGLLLGGPGLGAIHQLRDHRSTVGIGKAQPIQ